MAEIYIKVKGAWKYLFRIIDSKGNTLDFMLSAKRDAKAAKRFFQNALKDFWIVIPRVINVDKNPAYPSALKDLKAEELLPAETELSLNANILGILEISSSRILNLMASYRFSHFSSSEFDQLHLCLSSLFDINRSEFESCYQTLRAEFDIELEQQCSGLCLPRQSFQSTDSQFQQKYEKALLAGTDFPSLLEAQDNDVSQPKTVIILGQDPLRRGHQRIDDLTIATPYGLHLKYCRERHRTTRLYFELIKVLLDEGYRVYLTDIYKIWVSQEDCDRHVPLSRSDQQRFIQVLKDEISIMNATSVITWGRVASHFAIKELQLQPIDFPHPSGAANGTWTKLLGQRATRENKINYWKQELSAALAV